MMASSDPAERAAALEESVSVDGLATPDLIAAALTDPATAVRSKALAVAAQLPDERYIPRIVECLKEPDLRLAARSALAAFPASASLAALAAALDRDCPLPSGVARARPPFVPVPGLPGAPRPDGSTSALHIREASDAMLW
jgi:HEAT repeat protein